MLRQFGGKKCNGRQYTIHFIKKFGINGVFSYAQGRLVSKWKIMEDVFSGMAQSNAETYLNTTVYKLRKALEPHGMKSAIISAEEAL